MADQDQQSLIQQFKEFTQSNDSVAKFYLEAAKYDLNQAVENYFKFVKKPSAQSGGSSSRQTGAFSFRDLEGEDEPDDDEEQRYYAGSGQQLVGDNKKSSRLPDNTDDLTDKIFKKAQEQGAQSHEQFESQKKETFSGSGNRLGSTPSNNPAPQSNQPTQQQQPKEQKETKTVTITFYKEGFTIDDGELRRFDEPKNQEFLKAIDDGYVPREVAGMAHEVMVNLVNKKTESYVPPPKSFKAFEGGGRSLASSSSSAPAPSLNTGKAFSYTCDESKPITTIQIRLHDGTKLTAKFNLTDKIEILYQFVQHAKPMGGKQFSLMTTFPKKVLTDLNMTLEQAGLKNAAIAQTLV